MTTERGRTPLASLYAEYVRGDDGVVEVLGDALLERGEPPLPDNADAIARIEWVLARLPTATQLRIGCASVRRVMADHARPFPDVEPALAALERGEIRDDSRHAVFAAWRACGDVRVDAARVMWAIWMLLREMPGIALHTVRMIDGGELAAQVELIATALDGPA
jgi:hypothetical protein